MNAKKSSQQARKRFIAGICIGLLLTVSIAFFVAPVKRAQAFPGEALAAAVWKEARDAIRSIADRAWDAAKEAYKITKDVAFKNALRIYLTKIAEDTATYIATGDPGQKPLFLTNPGKYFTDVGDAALGDYLDTISTGALGTSICDIGPVKVKLDLALRAEINPNFCVDGCQQSFEKKLNDLKDYIGIRDFLKLQLTNYQSEQGTIAATQCPTHPDQASCDPDTLCEWDFDNLSGCIVNTHLSRDMDPYEKFGGGVPEDEALITELCEGVDDLFLCVNSFDQFIQSKQQQSDFERQRCVNLCVGAKRTAKCTYSQIAERTSSAFKETEQYYDTILDGFKTGNNEVSQYLQVYVAAREQSEAEKQKEKDTLSFSGVGPLRGLFGNIITPSTLTETASKKPVEEAGQDVTTYTGSPVADALGVFTDTLTKKLIERIFNPKQGGFSNPQIPNLFGGGGYNSGGIAAAKANFAKAFTPNVTRNSNQNVDSVSFLQGDNVLDQDFAEAVRQGLTVEEAVQKNLLHGDWWFGYNQNRQEPSVGNGGYPASSFPILRSYRIIPVGWEIAAQYNKDFDQGSFSLSSMMEKFSDDTSPYFQLVDPKWVLAAPLAVCGKEGFGGDIYDGTCQSSQVATITNSEEAGCQSGDHDTNGDGKCDENDPPIFENTCERVPSCVDTQTCIRETSDGKGCEEYGYCTKELPVWRFAGESCDSQFASCQAYTASNGELVSYLSDTTDSENCDANNVGCKGYCYTDRVTGEFSCYDNINKMYTAPAIFFDNDAESCASSDAGCREFFRMADGSNIAPNSSFEQYTSSFPAPGQVDFAGWTVGGFDQTCGAQSFTDPASTSGTTAMRLQQLTACAGLPEQEADLQIKAGIGASSLNGRTFTVSFNARAVNAPCSASVDIFNAATSASFTPGYTSEFRRYSQSITFGNNGGADMFIKIHVPAACSIVIDDLKVEEGKSATGHTQYGDNAIYLKTPPPHLSCTGAASDDPECASYALRCDEQNVGCSAFTPTSGGITIPARITHESKCDLSIPGSCDQCPAAYLGCKALKEQPLTAKIPDPLLVQRNSATLASIVPQSGRTCSAQYVGCEEYTNLNQAAQGGESREYYSQVRQCVSDTDPGSAFYFSWQGSDSTGFELKRWKLKASDRDGAPCTNLAVSPDINAVCQDAISTVNDCSTDTDNPSCIEFFNDAGNSFYRYLEEIIFATANCTGYRNTLDVQTYFFDPTESRTCPAQYAGCREYKGATANNAKKVITSTFEDTANPLDGWSGAGASLSSASITFPGHSLQISGTAQKTYAVKVGKSYVVSLWAIAQAGAPTISVEFDGVAVQNIPPPTVTTSATNWNLYRFGPLEATSANTRFEIVSSGGTVFVDNIVLEETTDNVFIVKGTAATCAGYENCSQYRDQNGKSHNLKSFTSLCKSQFVGCEALIDTQNSNTPEPIQLASENSYFNTQSGNYQTNVPEDQVVYMVNDKNKYCSSAAQGCQELGLPIVKQDGTVEAYESTYIKNDPDQYPESICSKDAVSCEAYQTVEDGSLAYFKNPGEQVCEYKENVGGGNLTGWFKKGTNLPCNTDWVKSCPAEQSTCRDFFAPRVYNNPASPDDQDYYFLASSVTGTDCPQGIDPRDSCIGFQDSISGPNTLRAKLDPSNPNVVISQSCTQCSGDSNTCGRNGNAPCCEWNSGECSTDRNAGLDPSAPYFCVAQASEEDFAQCEVSINDAFAVPNSSDIAQATNCGPNPGQPECFDMSAPVGAPNAYDVTKRYCGDFACSANIVLRVQPDRICEEWLECTNEQTIIRDGKETTVCLEREVVNRDGTFLTGTGDHEQKNLVKSQPGTTKELANYSGLVKAGVLSGANLVDGLFPYSQFTERGIQGALLEIPNSEFEDVKIAVQESPMPVVESGGTSPWIDSDTFDWKGTLDPNGEANSRILLEKTNTPDNFSNQYLTVLSQSTQENGARVFADTSGEITEDEDFYILSFRAKKSGTVSRGIKMALFQPGVGEIFTDSIGQSGLQLSTSWEDYVVQLNNNLGFTVDPEGAGIELQFLHRIGNTPGESFQIDNVKLKPVLYIQDSTSKTSVTGLFGYYFQAALTKAPLAQSGLAGNFWQNSAQLFSNLSWSGPTSSKTSSVIDFDPSSGTVLYNPDPGQAFATTSSAEWNGGIYIEDSNETTFYFNQNDAAQLFIEDMNTPLINKTTNNPTLGYSGKLKGIPVGWHPIKIRFVNNPNDGGLQLGWHVGPGGADFGTSLDGIHYDWSYSGVSIGIQGGGSTRCLGGTEQGSACDATNLCNGGGRCVGEGFYFSDPTIQAMSAHSTEFSQCGLWSDGTTSGTQVCLGGRDQGKFCSTDLDCAVGGGSCESFKLCSAANQPGSIVPSANLTTALALDTNNIFASLINTNNDKVIDFPNFNSQLAQLTKRGDAVGVRWVGEVEAAVTGDYLFRVSYDTGMKLFIDDMNTPVLDRWTTGPGSASVTMTNFSAGWHAIKLEYYKDMDAGQDIAALQLAWRPPGAAAITTIPTTSLRSYPPTPTGFVGRECRSYPQADSLICDYTDPQSGVIYKGWKGYCVERDPRDPSVCLNWWPIDALAGETNIFADQDQSLTRAPLYYCAETKKKPEPFATPRYICLSTYATSDDDGGTACETVAIATELKPAGYALSSNSGWVYGSGATPTSCNINLGDTATCCGVNDFGGAAFTSQELLRFACDDCNYFVIQNASLFNEAMTELQKYYSNIRIRHFTDDGSAFAEGCGADNPGDGDEACTNSGDNGRQDDCEYVQVYPNSCSGGYCTAQDGEDSDPNRLFYDDITWPTAYTFPLQCTTIVQVTKANGTSTPWANKVLNGVYEMHPTKYSLGTACAPFGALPVIKTVSDIVNCVPNPADPPLSGCSTVTGSCRESDYDEASNPNPAGSCILAPLEIYHPSNPDNGDAGKICSQTRLGAGFYSCGTTGICKTCVEGDRKGLLCIADSDCGGVAGSCQQTYGDVENTGNNTHVFAEVGQPIPTIPTTNDKSGIARMKLLFARSYGFWDWSDAAQKYIRKKDAAGRDFQNWTPPIDDNNPVFVGGVITNGGLCNDADFHKTQPNVYCGIRPTVSNIRVTGGVTDGTDIVLSGTNRTVQLEFNYAIDPEQLPLQSISINWGDGSTLPVYKSSSARKVYRFASTCPGNGSPITYRNDALGIPSTDACAYDNYPKIQVKDNWGWCNAKSGYFRCPTAEAGWDNFSGRIVVLRGN